MNTPEEPESKIRYIKTDNNTILNEQCIKWVKKRNECLEVCMKGNGCYIGDTHTICKSMNDTAYNMLNKHFE
jgi:hypothetical protein